MHQMLSVIWVESYSFDIHVKDSVKQGGVLSHILFTVYIDELLVRLKDSKVGCHILLVETKFMGTLIQFKG
jgi:hypothetical protein